MTDRGSQLDDAATSPIFVSMGSNLGEREAYLASALHSLSLRGISVLEQSPVYETKAVGIEDQPDFLNMVIRVQTDLAPHNLLKNLLQIEAEHGRVRDLKWGPRTLDLDLLFYGKLVEQSDDLILPHPHMHDRAFVLLPLQDLAPDWVHPLLGKTVREMVADVSGKGGVRRWEKPLANGCAPTES
ncbi:2-amino-4-hydroxy-6-hydroxymethyldihydropteridine diphosphokinase [Effusibacillus dendaii]|uniref:2-amino-4-hydroxy-6-hydroxymethyldihydropteridine diphosphokinase n=1 Tax=Effusibacillus dendaii TaxID=2743772 RepID=A0A7I8DEJ6_9BACL|nr:2-amino-4-hydroxy-6-hydroxymethyldihydropteridine diphosphokinase [Effusibacillus dendaii]BCJ87379.1 2-amino-4-hydroxy-6-hydroxymethyldihydropteridine diphosphokinase [Effusibacillus dendaii]